MRNFLVMLLVAASAALVVSCRRQGLPAGIGEAPREPVVSAGAGIEARAFVVGDPRALRELLKSDLPAGGIVPVYAAVSNRDTSTLVLHNRGGLPLGEQFRGLALDAGDGPLDPIHPLEVVMHLQGRSSAPDYRPPGAWQAVGGLAVPPLGVYYIFKWGGYALRYRPLLVHSFFPATRGGLLEPVRIGPGETAAGLLYFALDPGRSPYFAGQEPEAKRGNEPRPLWKIRDESGLELVVRPSMFPYGPAGGAVDSPYEVVGLRRVRWDGPAGGGNGAAATGPPEAAPGGDLFLLARPRAEGKTRLSSGGRFELLLGDLDALLRSRSTGGFVSVERLGGAAGEIADASRCGHYAVCAVNFRRRSRLFLVDTAGSGLRLAAQARLERRVLRVFSRPEGIYVITDNGFCGFYRYPDLKRAWYGRLGASAGEAFLSGRRLVVFGAGEAAEFDCSGGRCGGPKRRVPAPARSIGPGVAAGALIGADGAEPDGAPDSAAGLVHRGAGALGDTLVFYDTASLRARARMTFPGRVEVVAAGEAGLFLQTEGGLLLRLGPGDAGAPALKDAGWIPLRALALVAGEEELLVLAPDGTLHAFGFEAARPAPFCALPGSELRIPVGVGAE